MRNPITFLLCFYWAAFSFGEDLRYFSGATGLEAIAPYDANTDILLGSYQNDGLISLIPIAGKPLWSIRYRLAGASLIYFTSAKVSKAGTILVTGIIVRPDGDSDPLLMEIDRNGKSKWVRILAGLGRDYLHGLIETDNGYVVYGSTESSSRFGYSDILLVKLNKSGNVQTASVLGTPSSDSPVTLKQLPNSYIIAGSTGYFGNNDPAAAFVLTLNTHFRVVRAQQYFRIEQEYVRVLDGVISDSEVILAGKATMGTSKPLIFSVSLDGVYKWGKVFQTYSGSFNSVTRSGNSITAAGDVRTTASVSPDGFISKHNLSGARLWSKHLGGTPDAEVLDFLQRDSGTYRFLVDATWAGRASLLHTTTSSGTSSTCSLLSPFPVGVRAANLTARHLSILHQTIPLTFQTISLSGSPLSLPYSTQCPTF